jgi:hypothetical protein
MSDIIIHKAVSFTEILCGCPTTKTNTGWTNINPNVTCEDCITIMEIQAKNKE